MPQNTRNNAPDNPERLAAVPPGQRHSVLIRSLADLFSVVPEHLPEDMDRFEALFRPLYAQADPADRRIVVATLARRRDLPVAVAEDFLADDTEIAAFYLSAAPEPDETALLHAVVRGSLALRRLIARRPHLSEPVVLALLVAGEDEIVAELADNPTAEIPEHLIVELETEAEATAAAADVADALESAQQNAGISEDFLRFLAKEDAERLIDLNTRIAIAALRQVDGAGHTAPRAAPADLFAKACLGDRAGIARDLAATLDLAPGFAARIVDDRGGEALAIVLAALGVDNTLATSLMLLLLPDDTRTYWRLSMLRDLHERAGWRAGTEILAAWRVPRAAGTTAARQTEAAERPARPVARRRLLRPADLATRRA